LPWLNTATCVQPKQTKLTLAAANGDKDVEGRNLRMENIFNFNLLFQYCVVAYQTRYTSELFLKVASRVDLCIMWNSFSAAAAGAIMQASKPDRRTAAA
jgi:hypothetical protein